MECFKGAIPGRSRTCPAGRRAAFWRPKWLDGSALATHRPARLAVLSGGISRMLQGSLVRLARVCAGLVCVVPLVMTVPASGRPLTPAEQRYSAYSGRVPACNDGGVLSRISSRFSGRESEFWNSSLAIVSYDKVGELGLRSPGLDYIPRRYCIAQVLLNDGRISTVSYAIAEDLGFLGVPGYGVDWCIEGLDRNLAYSPGCKMARP